MVVFRSAPALNIQVTIRYPQPIRQGDTIAVMAPSSGVYPNGLSYLDAALDHLQAQGYRIVEGSCLRSHRKGASAPAKERSAELMRFLTSEDIAAVFPACGGELAIEILPHIDFEKLADLPPKWMLGFSDISTILLPLTILSGWATAHGEVVLGRLPYKTDPLTTQIMRVLQTKPGETIEQVSSAEHQAPDYSAPPPGPYTVAKKTLWETLGKDLSAQTNMKGRLIGGCLDRIARLAGTKYGNIPSFIQKNSQDGVILHLENACMSPTELGRTLIALRMNGWFDGISGLMFGRSSGPPGQPIDDLSYQEVLESSLSGTEYPILINVDIGHQSPQMTLIQGSLVEVQASCGNGKVTQTFS